MPSIKFSEQLKQRQLGRSTRTYRFGSQPFRSMLTSRQGQMFTVEFAIAVVGAVVVAFIVGRIAQWGVDYLAELNNQVQITRPASGQSGGAAGQPFVVEQNIDLIGPDGAEELRFTNIDATRVHLYDGTPCSTDGLDQGQNLRSEASNLLSQTGQPMGEARRHVSKALDKLGEDPPDYAGAQDEQNKANNIISGQVVPLVQQVFERLTAAERAEMGVLRGCR